MGERDDAYVIGIIANVEQGVQDAKRVQADPESRLDKRGAQYCRDAPRNGTAVARQLST